MKARTVEQARRERARTRRLAIGVILLMLASGLITAGMWYVGHRSKSQTQGPSAGSAGGFALKSSAAADATPAVQAPTTPQVNARSSAEDELLDAFPPGAGPVRDTELAAESEETLVSFNEAEGAIPAAGDREPGPSFADRAEPSDTPMMLATAPPPAPTGSLAPAFVPGGGGPRIDPGKGPVPLAPVPEPASWTFLSLTPILIWWSRRRSSPPVAWGQSTSAA